MGLSNSIVALCFLLACTTPRATGPAYHQMNDYYVDRTAPVVHRVPVVPVKPSVEVQQNQERKLQFEKLNDKLQETETELRGIRDKLPQREQ